jgi:hypothetical protein
VLQLQLQVHSLLPVAVVLATVQQELLPLLLLAVLDLHLEQVEMVRQLAHAVVEAVASIQAVEMILFMVSLVALASNKAVLVADLLQLMHQVTVTKQVVLVAEQLPITLVRVTLLLVTVVVTVVAVVLALVEQVLDKQVDHLTQVQVRLILLVQIPDTV